MSRPRRWRARDDTRAGGAQRQQQQHTRSTSAKAGAGASWSSVRSSAPVNELLACVFRHVRASTRARGGSSGGGAYTCAESGKNSAHAHTSRAGLLLRGAQSAECDGEQQVVTFPSPLCVSAAPASRRPQQRRRPPSMQHCSIAGFRALSLQSGYANQARNEGLAPAPPARRRCTAEQTSLDLFSICACHPCAGAMLIFSVYIQVYQVSISRQPLDGGRRVCSALCARWRRRCAPHVTLASLCCQLAAQAPARLGLLRAL